MKTVAVLAILFAGTTLADARTSDVGRFVVVQAVVNPLLDARQRQYFTDDPRFVGRIVEIAPQRLAFEGRSPCSKVQRTRRIGSLGGLLRKGFDAELIARRPLQPRIGPVLGSVEKRKEIITYRCLTPDTGQVGGPVGSKWNGASSLPLDERRRALLLSYEVVLVLQPMIARQPDALVCAGATNASGVAICSISRVL